MLKKIELDVQKSTLLQTAKTITNHTFEVVLGKISHPPLKNLGIQQAIILRVSQFNISEFDYIMYSP